MAVAGYTAATKADQVSVLVNNATASALSAYVSQNYGAGKWKRIRQGVHAALIQTQCLNLMMGVGILLLRRPIVEMFLANPPKEVIWYSNGYLNWVAPCYLILGALRSMYCHTSCMDWGRQLCNVCVLRYAAENAACRLPFGYCKFGY